MTTTTHAQEAKSAHKGKPGWVTKRHAINLGETHERLLNELVAQAQEANHRASITTVIEEAIRALHDARI